jgi:hypothetical protein
MKKTIVAILLIVIVCRGVGQGKEDSVVKNVEYKPSSNLWLGFAVSPLLHTNTNLSSPASIDNEYNKTHLSLPFGLIFSFRNDKDYGVGFSIGALADFKKYELHYYSSGILNSSYIDKHITYNYLYIPLQFNIYFKKTIINIGCMTRMPIFVKGGIWSDVINYHVNSSVGIELGVGQIFPSPYHKINFKIEPYAIFMPLSQNYSGHWNSNSGTVSGGILLGINLVIIRKIIKST